MLKNSRSTLRKEVWNSAVPTRQTAINSLTRKILMEIRYRYPVESIANELERERLLPARSDRLNDAKIATPALENLMIKCIFYIGWAAFFTTWSCAASAFTQCSAGNTFEQAECIAPQMEQAKEYSAAIVQKLKKERPELAELIDDVVVSEAQSRARYCELAGALEDGEDRWRAIWRFECEVQELERFTRTLGQYAR